MANDMKKPVLANMMWIICLRPFLFKCMSSGSYICVGREERREESREGKREKRKRRERKRENSITILSTVYSDSDISYQIH